MTGGFNSDIVLEGVVYHVQTEDKGTRKREVVSQVFRDGAVIFTQRTPYPPEIDARESQPLLEELVRGQHLKLLQFIRAGGMKKNRDGEITAPPASTLSMPLLTVPIEDSRRKTLGLGSKVHPWPKAKNAEPEKAGGGPREAADPGETRILGTFGLGVRDPIGAFPAGDPPIPEPTVEIPVPLQGYQPGEVPALSQNEELVIEAFLNDLGLKTEHDQVAAATPPPQAIPPAPVPTADLVPPLPPIHGSEVEGASLVEPAPVLSQDEKCEIQLLSSGPISAGEVQALSFCIRSDRQQLPIPDARVEVRIFGKTIRPLTYLGRTDSLGMFSVEILVPHYTVGDGHVEIEARTRLGSKVLKLDVKRSPASK